VPARKAGADLGHAGQTTAPDGFGERGLDRLQSVSKSAGCNRPVPMRRLPRGDPSRPRAGIDRFAQQIRQYSALGQVGRRPTKEPDGLEAPRRCGRSGKIRAGIGIDDEFRIAEQRGDPSLRCGAAGQRPPSRELDALLRRQWCPRPTKTSSIGVSFRRSKRSRQRRATWTTLTGVALSSGWPETRSTAAPTSRWSRISLSGTRSASATRRGTSGASQGCVIERNMVFAVLREEHPREAARCEQRLLSIQIIFPGRGG
jgi:hypothetical protein